MVRLQSTGHRFVGVTNGGAFTISNAWRPVITVDRVLEGRQLQAGINLSIALSNCIFTHSFWRETKLLACLCLVDLRLWVLVSLPFFFISWRGVCWILGEPSTAGKHSLSFSQCFSNSSRRGWSSISDPSEAAPQLSASSSLSSTLDLLWGTCECLLHYSSLSDCPYCHSNTTRSTADLWAAVSVADLTGGRIWNCVVISDLSDSPLALKHRTLLQGG